MNAFGLEILYNKGDMYYTAEKNVDLFVCPASFIIPRVSDQLILHSSLGP